MHSLTLLLLLAVAFKTTHGRLAEPLTLPSVICEYATPTTSSTLISTEIITVLVSTTILVTTTQTEIHTPSSCIPENLCPGIDKPGFYANYTAPVIPSGCSQPEAPSPTYAPGQCCMHLTEIWLCTWGMGAECGINDHDLYGEITLLDQNKTPIFVTGDNGYPINDHDHTVLLGVLPLPLHITAEHTNDYIQFSYGDVSWTNNDGPAPVVLPPEHNDPLPPPPDYHIPTCNTGGWDPRSMYCGPDPVDPSLWPKQGTMIFKRQMDCCFPC